MGQEELDTCDVCAISASITFSKWREKVCETCALDLHVCNTAARVVPYAANDGKVSLSVVLVDRHGSETQSRKMTTIEMQSFITRAQDALGWACAMEEDDDDE